MNPLTDLNLRVSLFKGTAYTWFLALLPIIYYLKTPGVTQGLGTSCIVIGMIYAGCVIYRYFQKIDLSIILPMIPYLTYSWLYSSSDNKLLMIAVFFHLAAVSTGCVDTAKLRRIMETVAVIASVIVLFEQMIGIFGIRINFLFNAIVIPSQVRSASYDSIIMTGLPHGFQRVSAFFWEPSEMAKYGAIALGSCLFALKPDIKKAIIITIGIFACTSGMGVVYAVAMWGWWKLSASEDMPLPKKISILVSILIVTVVAYLLLDNIPFFHKIFSRFIDTPEGEMSALEGRTFGWDILFADKDFWELFWGYGSENLPDFYLTGFMSQLYVYGYAGVILLAVFLTRLILGAKGLARTIAIIFASLYFIAGIGGFLSLIFFGGVILALNYQNNHPEEYEEIRTDR